MLHTMLLLVGFGMGVVVWVSLTRTFLRPVGVALRIIVQGGLRRMTRARA